MDTAIDTITITADPEALVSTNVSAMTSMSPFGNVNIIGDLSIDGTITATPIWTWQDTSNQVIIGDNYSDKQKIYIVEPWQSRKPIKVKDGLYVSLEQDLISNDEIKKQILEKIEDEHPDLAIKMGLNPDNIKLVKSEVNLEINKEFR